jgi:glycosyltransferase involved in cell wall biosynthesis
MRASTTVPLQRIPRGYGAALDAAVKAARGYYVLIADADDSYDFSHAPRFLADLRNGADLADGNRFRGRNRAERDSVTAPLRRKSRFKLQCGHPTRPTGAFTGEICFV